MAELIDRKDVEILKRLKVDSRTPMGSIGNKLNISKATVSRRVARMEDENIIRKYSMDVDLTSMGIMKSLVMIQVVGTPTAVIMRRSVASTRHSVITISYVRYTRRMWMRYTR